MKCPKCGNTPVSLLKYTIHPNLRRTQCIHCGALLKRNRRSYLVWYIASLLAITIGLSLALLAVYLQERADWNTGAAFLLAVGLLIIVGIPIELLLFKYEQYSVEENAQPPKPDSTE